MIAPHVSVRQVGERLEVEIFFRIKGTMESVPASRVLAAWQRGVAEVHVPKGPVCLPREWMLRYASAVHDVLMLKKLHRKGLPVAFYRPSGIETISRNTA